MLKNIPTFLIVDDDATMARLLAKVTERAFGGELRVESIIDPHTALKRIEQGGVDILLTDLEMPGIDGIDILKYAKRRNAYTQVIVLTGNSSDQALLTALECGANDYLLKPVDQLALVDLLRQTCQRRLRWQRALVDTWQKQKQACASE
ncbi:MAG: response regulator [Pirellulales bacterium]|nr:response regulator [Pirellulales bacterium]